MGVFSAASAPLRDPSFPFRYEMASHSHLLIDASESVVHDGAVIRERRRPFASVACAAANVPRRAIGGRARCRAR